MGLDVGKAHIDEEHRGKGLYQLALRHIANMPGTEVSSFPWQRSSDAKRAWDRVATEPLVQTNGQESTRVLSQDEAKTKLARLDSAVAEEVVKRENQRRQG